MINLNFKRKSKIILVGILFGISFLAMLPIQSNFNQNERITQNTISSASVPHVPISIADETALLAFVASESLNGSGTEVDPFVIENYDIDCGGSVNGIEIFSGITSYVLIKNCEIRNGSFGILISDTPNVDVSNCTIESMVGYGILMTGASSIGNYIENCYVNDTWYGIYGSYAGKVSNCIVLNTISYAILSFDGIIEKCITYNNEYAVKILGNFITTIRQNLFFNYTNLLDGYSTPELILWDNNILGIDGDGDGDGISDHDEYFIYGTDRFLIDTDMDGYHDGYEILSGFDPLDNLSPTLEDLGISVDTDNDGLDDSEELELGTDPLIDDTDGDGFNDGIEVFSGTDPLDSNDYPGVGEDEPSGIPGFSLIFLAPFILIGIILIYKKMKLEKK
jgi:hypothetical protein